MKEFVVTNANLLTRELQKAILTRVLLEVGEDAVKDVSTATMKETDIDLDLVAMKNPETLIQIYNSVEAYRNHLNQPNVDTGKH